jgi:glycosyltransferase involved in cell wall biosynthesis
VNGVPTLDRPVYREQPHQTPEYTILYSSNDQLDLDKTLGDRHYSYRFVETHFVRMMEFLGVPIGRVPMPEYYGRKSALAAEIGPLAEQPLHLIFRTPEEIRLLRFAYNIACFAWEFDVLKDTTLVGEHPFLNQKRMLGIVDEIWVPSQYTKSVLASHGLANAHRIPAPIVMPQHGRRDRRDALRHLADVTVCPLFVNFLIPKTANRAVCQSRSLSLGDWLARGAASREGPRIYLAVLNPEDFRKNLDTMLRGFYYFAAAEPDCVLLVKALTARSRFTLADVVADVVRTKMAPGTNLECDRIAFFNDFLGDDALSSLYSLADFYLCTAVAEGQNLPLLEAMAHGVVPVTTRHTAMLDYIDDDNAIIVRDHSIPNDCEHFAACAADKPFRINRCEFSDVYEALMRSARLAEADRSSISYRSADTVRERYSYEAVWALVQSRLQSLAAAPSGRAMRRE